MADMQENLLRAIDVWGASPITAILEEAARIGSDPSIRPWRGGVYEPMISGRPAVEVLAELANRPEVTRIEYRFGKRSGGGGEMISVRAQRGRR